MPFPGPGGVAAGDASFMYDTRIQNFALRTPFSLALATMQFLGFRVGSAAPGPGFKIEQCFASNSNIEEKL